MRSKRNIGYLELKKLGDLIVNIDAFYLFTNFAILHKIMKPFVDSWNERAHASSINNSFASLFMTINERFSRFDNKINKVLPQFVKLKKYFEEKTGISLKGEGISTENSSKMEDYLKKLFGK